MSDVLPSVLVWIPKNNPDSWMGSWCEDRVPWTPDLSLMWYSWNFLGTSLQRNSCVMTRHCPIFSMIRLVQATHKMDCVIQCFCLYSQLGRVQVLSCLRWLEPGYIPCAWDSSTMCLRAPQPGARCHLSSFIAPYAMVPWNLSVAPQFPRGATELVKPWTHILSL